MFESVSLVSFLLILIEIVIISSQIIPVLVSPILRLYQNNVQYTPPRILKTFVQKIGGDGGLRIAQENCFQYVTAKEKEKFHYAILKIID